MNFRNKVIIILGICLLTCVGAFFLIKQMFENIENQLLEKAKIEAQVGSRVMSDIIEILISNGILGEADALDTNYVPIPGTKPQKYTTRYDKIFDKHIQGIEDEFLKDPDIDFAVLIDKNAYVPTHNKKYSLPQTGDYKKDLKESRSKRRYDQFPAIAKILLSTDTETKKFLYQRDTGEVMWIMGGPVFVRGKRWGAFLMSVSLERMEVLKNQMLIMTITIMFVILSLTMLSILAVIPRRLFSPNIEIP